MKVTSKLLMAVLVALTVSTLGQAAPPNGLWTGNGNGYTMLLILSVDKSGNVTGFFNNDTIKGFWNDSARRLTFHRETGAVNINGLVPPDQMQVFTGYTFPCDYPLAALGKQCLAGSFEGFAGTGASASDNVFGWLAFKMTQ